MTCELCHWPTQGPSAVISVSEQKILQHTQVYSACRRGALDELEQLLSADPPPGIDFTEKVRCGARYRHDIGEH